VTCALRLLRSAYIDRGRTGDNVGDPAAAPLGTGNEAAGTPTERLCSGRKTPTTPSAAVYTRV